MKNIKNAIFAFTILLLSTGMYSCDYDNYPTNQSIWIVSKIEYLDKVNSLYLAKTIDTTNLNTHNTWVADSIGKFEVGDTLVFSKISH